MPDKDGDDDKKSTKSVVNKKQKQMMGEEGYDIARDMGRVRPSKDKKDATTMPVSKEMRKTQKVNKGPSALELVKKKYGKSVMNVGKKKANEELDLTQVAEAFGGYIIESQKKDRDTRGLGQSQRKITKKQKEIIKSPEAQAKDELATRQQVDQLKKVVSTTAKTDPIVDQEMGALGKKGIEAKKAIEKETGRRTLEPASGTGLPTDADDATTGVAPGEKAAPVYSFRVGTEREGPVAKSQRLKREKAEAEAAAKKKAEKSAAASERNRNRKLVGSGSREVSPETQKKIDAVTPPFATKQGETGPLPVSMRNRRVPKTSSLSPNVKVTSIVKPKVGALARTDQETSAITKGQIDYKALQDKIKTVSLGKGMEVVDEPKTRKRGGALGVDTGRTVDGQVIPDEPPKIVGYIPPETQPKPSMLDRLLDRTRRNRTKTDVKTDKETKLLPPSTKPDLTKLLDPKRNKKILDFPPFPTPSRTGDEPKEDPIGGGGDDPPKKKTKVGNFSYRPGGAYSRIRGFARKNPVLSLVGYDALKNLRAPSVTKPTKTGKVSAGQ